MVQSSGLKGYLFLYTTHSYAPQAGWQDQMLQEAVDGTYSDLANGWTCMTTKADGPALCALEKK
jgi:hypothetical protein